MSSDTTRDTNSADPKSKDSTSSLFSYKGPVAGLKGLLTSKIAEGLATVASKIDKVAESVNERREGGTEKIAIEKIYPSADQPRQVFDSESLEELAQTMRELGQAQAITVRRAENGFFEIISGERRFRAAKLAGLSHLDCVVKECSPKEGRLLALVENIQRQDLLPIEEAHFLKKVLSENSDLSLVKLAKRLGTHKSTLSEKIQLTEIPEEFQSLLYGKGRHLTHRHWRVLSRIKDQAFLRNLFVQAIEHRLSVAELERSLQAAGVQKATRSRARKEGELVSQMPLDFVKHEGNSLKIRALTLDLQKLSGDSRQKLIEELGQIVDALKAAPQDS